MICTPCGKTLTDSVEHGMMRCEGLLAERNNIWDKLFDGVEVHAEANMLNKCDMNILDILLGRRWSKLTNVSDINNFHSTISQFVCQTKLQLGI